MEYLIDPENFASAEEQDGGPAVVCVWTWGGGAVPIYQGTWQECGRIAQAIRDAVRTWEEAPSGAERGE